MHVGVYVSGGEESAMLIHAALGIHICEQW